MPNHNFDMSSFQNELQDVMRLLENVDLDLHVSPSMEKERHQITSSIRKAFKHECSKDQLTSHAKLYRLLKNCLTKKQSVSLYLRGPSKIENCLVLQDIITLQEVQMNFEIQIIDCSREDVPSDTSSSFVLRDKSQDDDIFKKILKMINADIVTIAETSEGRTAQILKVLRNKERPTLIILEEIHELIAENEDNRKNLETLKMMYTLPSLLPDGKIAMIATGEVADLDCFFSSEVAFLKNPTIMEYCIRSGDEVVDMTKKILNEMTLECILIETKAIEFLGRRAASANGNIKISSKIITRVLRKCINYCIDNTSDGFCVIDKESVQNVVEEIIEDVLIKEKTRFWLRI